MDKKIDILTLQTINYGGILQNLALQNTLKSLGYECETINVVEKSQKKKFPKNLFSFIYRRCFLRIFGDKVRKKRTNDFIRKNICLTEKVLEHDFDSSKYANVLVGSDQVWNDKYINNSDLYFWPYKKPKTLVSYAASFGYNFDYYSPKKEHVSLLKNFDSLSVRENDSSKFLEKELKRKIPVVLDPTLLVKKPVWIEFSKQSQFFAKERFGFVYMMPGDKVLESKILNLAKKQSEKDGTIFYIAGFKELSKMSFLSECIRGIGPAEWLYLLNNSEWVITNSFHGTVFSVIFGKRFLTVVNDRSSTNFPNRILSFLNNIDGLDHVLNIDNESDISLNPLRSSNNWLEKEVNESISWLKNSLN